MTRAAVAVTSFISGLSIESLAQHEPGYAGAFAILVSIVITREYIAWTRKRS